MRNNYSYRVYCFADSNDIDPDMIVLDRNGRKRTLGVLLEDISDDAYADGCWDGRTDEW